MADNSIELTRLYHQAFDNHGTRALWNMRAVPNPTPRDALALSHALRVHGRMEGRRLAEQIEALCCADR